MLNRFAALTVLTFVLGWGFAYLMYRSAGCSAAAPC